MAINRQRQQTQGFWPHGTRSWPINDHKVLTFKSTGLGARVWIRIHLGFFFFCFPFSLVNNTDFNTILICQNAGQKQEQIVPSLACVYRSNLYGEFKVYITPRYNRNMKGVQHSCQVTSELQSISKIIMSVIYASPQSSSDSSFSCNSCKMSSLELWCSLTVLIFLQLINWTLYWWLWMMDLLSGDWNLVKFSRNV